MKELFGQRLREQRIKHGLTLEQLAEKSELSSNYIGMVERGLKEPGLATIVKLLNALNISADTLLCDLVPSASHVTDDEICKRLEGLSPIQKKRHSICWIPISAISLTSQTRNKIANFASASAEIWPVRFSFAFLSAIIILIGCIVS